MTEPGDLSRRRRVSVKRESPRIDAALAARIRIVGLDIDGTLTDGGVYLGATDLANALPSAPGRDIDHAPFELKRYDIQDGVGIFLLRQVGIKVVIVTGRVSYSVSNRARELGIDAVAQDPRAMKLAGWRRILRDFGLSNDDAAFVGDDLPDLPILREVALSVAVGNACDEVRQACHVQLVRRGGHGAVREFAEALLKARGTWSAAVDEYVRERSRIDTAPGPAAGPGQMVRS
jgi:3-deoxy-D-manno-octulosonate 8-phosphate phosphatase (KDO 8-P phosphatase)